jgi:hypothetical protein
MRKADTRKDRVRKKLGKDQAKEEVNNHKNGENGR